MPYEEQGRRRVDEEPEDFRERLEFWYEHDEHKKIIAAIEAVPEAERDFDLVSQLGRALNNNDESHKAIAVLRSVEAQGQNDALWHFRLGYAYFYDECCRDRLENLKVAQAHFQRAYELGDASGKEFCQYCKNKRYLLINAAKHAPVPKTAAEAE